MNELQNEIINKIDNLEEIKQLKELIKKLNSNEEYISLMKEFEKNQKKYINDNIIRDKVIELRKKLFQIDELKQYVTNLTTIRLFSNKISNIISSIVDYKNC